MKKLIARLKSYHNIRKTKHTIKKVFKAYKYFDDKFNCNPNKIHYWSEFLYLFPEVGTFRMFYANICASLQIIFEYMSKTRDNWYKIVEVNDGNFIFNGKEVRFMIETSKLPDYDHDMFVTIGDITNEVDICVSIEYGSDKMDGLQDCCINGLEVSIFKMVGCMIADALASIYVESRSRGEKVK